MRAQALKNPRAAERDPLTLTHPPRAPPRHRQLTAAEFSADSSLLATGSLDSSVILWHPESGHAAALFVGDAAVTSLAFAAGGRGAPHTLVVGDAAGGVHFLCGFPHCREPAA